MKLINRFTGQEVELSGIMTPGERSLWRLKKRIRDFDNCVQREHLQVSFLTITQSDKSVGEGYRWITNVMHAMGKQFKRAGHKFYYVAVLEIQPKRYRERGVLAPHWHIAIATSCDKGLPHASRTKEGRIKKERNGSIVTWDWLLQNIKQKFGMYFVCDCYSPHVYDYLGKYIAKGSELEDFKRKLGKRVRVFSASRMPVEFQMSEGQSGEYASLVEKLPEVGELYWRREDSRIVGRAKEVIEKPFRDMIFRKVRYPRVFTIKADWLPAEGQIDP